MTALSTRVDPAVSPPRQGDPAAIYRARRDRFASERDRLMARWNAVANLRPLLFLTAASCAGWMLYSRIWFLGIVAGGLLIAFLVAVAYHARLNRARQRAETLRVINEEAIARLAREWAAVPQRSAALAPVEHPYAGDLHLFGPGSLFHLLYAGATEYGETSLRDWLLTFATPEEIRARQGAVAELAPVIDLRDDLIAAARGATGPSPDLEPFLAWAEGEPWVLHRPLLLFAARVVPLLFWATLLLWLTGIVAAPLWLGCYAVIELLYQVLGRRATRLLAIVAARQEALQHYAASLGVLDSASFNAPSLAALRGDLTADGISAYRQMRRLERLARLVIPATSLSHSIVQRLLLWDLQVLAATEHWQRAAGRRARRWLVALGEIEALTALAGVAHAQPDWSFPILDEEAMTIVATDLGHPLLADGVRVGNDVAVGPVGTFLLVTGSNMSGKSTLLRAIGVNTVLAGAGGVICARDMTLPPVTLWTSMRVEDSLTEGVSFYLAELRRLKAIVLAEPGVTGGTLLYLLDEILQGTNTAERQIAARRIIAHLLGRRAIGAVSTHDLDLAESPRLSGAARRVHFTEQFTSGAEGPAMTFDYRLRPGLATSTNALRLMELIGLDLAGEDV